MANDTQHITGSQEVQELGNRLTCAKRVLDFSVFNATCGDAVQALQIPANAKVMEVHSVVKTAEGKTAVATVGDGAGANSWDASINLDAAAATPTRSTPGTDAYATTGKFYAAADTIDIVPSVNLDTGAVIISAVYQMIEDYSA